MFIFLGSDVTDKDSIAMPVCPTVHFAGEHTVNGMWRYIDVNHVNQSMMGRQHLLSRVCLKIVSLEA